MKKFFNKIWFYLNRCIPIVSCFLALICFNLGYDYFTILYLLIICIWFLADIRVDLTDFLKSSGKKSVDNK